MEDRISSQDVIHEVEEELRNQINTMKQIKDDLEQHSGQVSHCADQVRQLVLTAGKTQLCYGMYFNNRIYNKSIKPFLQFSSLDKHL